MRALSQQASLHSRGRRTMRRDVWRGVQRIPAPLMLVFIVGCMPLEPLEKWSSIQPPGQCAAEQSSAGLAELVENRDLEGLRRVCKNGTAWACYWLGDNFSAGVEQNEALGQACALGLPVGCARLHQLTGDEQYLRQAASNWFNCCCSNGACDIGQSGLDYCLDRARFIVQMGGANHLLEFTVPAERNTDVSEDRRRNASLLSDKVKRLATAPLRISVYTILLVAGCGVMAGWTRWRRRSAARASPP